MLFLSFNKTHLSKIWLYITYSRIIRVRSNSTIAKVSITLACLWQTMAGCGHILPSAGWSPAAEKWEAEGGSTPQLAVLHACSTESAVLGCICVGRCILLLLFLYIHFDCLTLYKMLALLVSQAELTTWKNYLQAKVTFVFMPLILHLKKCFGLAAQIELLNENLSCVSSWMLLLSPNLWQAPVLLPVSTNTCKRSKS